MFKLMCENIYGMMVVSSEALKGNVILIYHNQTDLIFCEYCHSKIKQEIVFKKDKAKPMISKKCEDTVNYSK